MRTCAQVLMTHDAWERLRHSMPAAGFPVVEQLGLAKIAAWPVPIWIYQVLQPCHLVPCFSCLGSSLHTVHPCGLNEGC